jgi:tyrosine-protein kinase Etk/Wzc
VRLDEEAYLSYVRTAEQSRLSSALEKSKLLRLTVIEPADVPMQPVAPRKGRILAFALLGGLLVAVGVGVARDQFNSTVKSAADVRRYAGLDVLTALPERG